MTKQYISDIITEDTLEEHLRLLVYSKITKHLEKLKCEHCGSIDKLELHHSLEYKFSDIVYDSLSILKIPYKKYWKEYSNEEIRLIEIVMLGLHLYTNFLVLCSRCHDEEHRKHESHKARVNKKILSTKYKDQILYYQSIYPNNNIDDFFYNFNKFYLKEVIKKHKYSCIVGDEEIENFKQLLSQTLVYEHIGFLARQKKTSMNLKTWGINIINRIFALYNLKYKIISGDFFKLLHKRKKYWIIVYTRDTDESIKYKLRIAKQNRIKNYKNNKDIEPMEKEIF